MDSPEDRPDNSLSVNAISPAPRSEGPRDAWGPIPPDKSVRHLLVLAAVFGALVGLAMGAVVGAAVCWLVEEYDSLWDGVLVGALVGPFAGAALGAAERKVRGAFVRPDTGTVICVSFCLPPALLLGLLIFGSAKGLGVAFAGPMAGLILGGIFDRAFDAVLKRSWGAALPFATGVAVCVGLVYLIDAAASGPAPEEVSRQARDLIEWELKADLADGPTMVHKVPTGFKVHKITLVRSGRLTYAGFAEVTFANQRDRRPLEARVEKGMLYLNWTEEPQQ